MFPPEEDFWLVPLEAMASWTPVIAFGKWGALETVVENKTGIFFQEQTIESVNKAIELFEKKHFDKTIIREHAEKFDKDIFKSNLYEFINRKLK
jgi:glycosyltransferase involved in cell wall biosynthesis